MTKSAPLLLLFLAASVCADPGQNVIAVLNYDPPRVTLVDAGQAKILSRIPLASHPMKMLMSPRGDFLYVLHHGAGCRDDVLFPEEIWRYRGTAERRWKEPSSISVVDLEKQRVLKSLELSWNVSDLLLTDDGKYIVAMGVGRNGKDKPPQNEMGMIQVIDTQTNEFVSRTAVGRDQSAMAATRLGTRVFSLAANEFEGLHFWSGPPRWLWGSSAEAAHCEGFKLPKVGSFTLSIIDPLRPQVLAQIPLPGMPSVLKLSEDERWLYVLDFGSPDDNPDKNKDAAVHVIDVEKAALKETYRVGANPSVWKLDRRTNQLLILSERSAQDHTGILYRFEDGALQRVSEVGSEPLMLWQDEDFEQPAVVTKSEVCLIDAAGKPQKPCLDLSQMELARGPGGNVKLEIHYLPARPALMLRSGKHGDQVMLGDLHQGQTGLRFELGSEEARTSKLASNTARNVGLGLLFFLSGGKADIQFPESAWQRIPIRVSADGRFAYAANTYTNEVTVLDVASGKPAKVLSLAANALGLSISPDGKWLGAFSKKRALLIDMASNEVRVDTDPPGDLGALLWTADGTRFLALTHKALAIWQTDATKQIGIVEDFSRAIQMLERPAR